MWWERYLDIPFLEHGRSQAGCDCWGLVRLAWAEQRGVELPAWDAYTDIKDRPAIQGLLAEALAGFQEIVAPEEFAIALFRSAVSVFHVGLMVDRERMLHIERDAGVWVQPWTVYRPQFQGFFMPIYKKE
jgi:cell wall-associated NlpC family hydrolase